MVAGLLEQILDLLGGGQRAHVETGGRGQDTSGGGTGLFGIDDQQISPALGQQLDLLPR